MLQRLDIQTGRHSETFYSSKHITTTHAHIKIR